MAEVGVMHSEPRPILKRKARKQAGEGSRSRACNTYERAQIAK